MSTGDYHHLIILDFFKKLSASYKHLSIRMAYHGALFYKIFFIKG